MPRQKQSSQSRKWELVNRSMVVRTLADVAVATGKSTRTIREWIAEGCDCKEGNGYSITSIFEWREQRKLSRNDPGLKVHSPDPEDPLLADSVPTEALERLRLATAKIKELELSVKKGELVPIDDLRNLLLQASSRIREAGDRLGRMFGREAQLVLDEAIDAAEELIDQMGSDGNGTG